MAIRNVGKAKEISKLLVYSMKLFQPKLSDNALKVLRDRYLLRDKKGRVSETPPELFLRVANNIASADKRYPLSAKNWLKTGRDFYEMMARQEFLPNTPTLMNAGAILQQLAACFVLPIKDSLEDIFDSLKNMVLIHRSGGGTGFSFSPLRPKNTLVMSTKGYASGPVSFMKIFDVATEVIKQGGKRRGANMGILSIHHPDILEFINCKTTEGQITNFNISVAATDEFMKAVTKRSTYAVRDPRDNKEVGRLHAHHIFDSIVKAAWQTGDPGMIFIDVINRYNPTPQLGRIEATNPCGEQPLLPFDACNLGSINLAKTVKMVKGHYQIDWEKLRDLIDKGVHFLDNIIDVNRYPLPLIDKMTKLTRKIGLGVMGFADMLILLEIPYDSKEALDFAEKISKFMRQEADKKSIELGRQRGAFGAFKGSIYDGGPPMRNSTRLTVAPTGTISMIGDCSSGIEPLFAISFIKHVLGGKNLLYVHDNFVKTAKDRGFYSEKLMREISKTGSVQKTKEVPAGVKRIYRVAYDIKSEWHVRMQAAWQKHVDNAISKTINLPETANWKDIRKVYLLAYKLGCKGITVFRNKSKKEQVLYIGRPEEKRELNIRTGVCPECGAPIHATEGYKICASCGWE